MCLRTGIWPSLASSALLEICWKCFCKFPIPSRCNGDENIMRTGAYVTRCILITQNVHRRQRDSSQKMPMITPHHSGMNKIDADTIIPAIASPIHSCRLQMNILLVSFWSFAVNDEAISTEIKFDLFFPNNSQDLSDGALRNISCEDVGEQEWWELLREVDGLKLRHKSHETFLCNTKLSVSGRRQ